MDVVGVHYAGGGTFNGIQKCTYTTAFPEVSWVHANGSVPLVTWTPGSITSDSVLKAVISGSRDDCIGAVADQLKSYGFRIMLRPFHEFDWYQYHKRADGTYDYSTNGGASVDPVLGGQAVATAFRHVVDVFKAHGATNVGFIWNPDEGGGSRLMQDYAYPGDGYVDWVASDRYNGCGTNCWASPYGSGWADFNKIFNYPASLTGGEGNIHQRFAVAHGKPFFIPETSSKYDASDVNRKGNWFASIAKAKDPSDASSPSYYLSNLIGVEVFDQYVTAENNNDSRIDSNQTPEMHDAGILGSFSQESLNGWVRWAHDARWNVGVSGGAT
jgi:hypothetical protein